MENNAAIAIPTYNEKDNIVKIIGEINSLGLAVDILVVDDNSPDGTGEIVESMKKTMPNLDVIHRPRKEGLGPAYVAAFRYFLDKGKHDYIFEMDADFSHNPKDIPRLLERARTCDVVVGSRYVKGGGVSDKWSNTRKNISKLGNLYARIITGLKVKDCTSGFKCYRKKVLQSIALDKLSLNGYGFQIQTLYQSRKNNFGICEIPIFFDERIRGKSKMHLRIVLEAFASLPLMRIRDIFGRK